MNSDKSRVNKRSWAESKESKKLRALKSARIIVRNLPFKTTEEKVKAHFSQYGRVVEATLLRKGDKLVGCGFVQFDKKNSAAKAIFRSCSEKFSGRQIVCDWAVPKDKFLSLRRSVKKEENEVTNQKIKEEKESDVELSDYEFKDEPIIDKIIKDNEQRIKLDESTSSESEKNEESSEDDSEEPIKLEDEKPEKVLENDVSEGKTVFLTNVPFDITKEDLKEFLKDKFGDLVYVIICLDPLTEHSKGSAFAKFKTMESAEKCIASCHGEELCGRNMIARLAVSKKNLESHKLKQPKDRRNLYLAKEGVILPGSTASVGVSPSDMEKRVFLEQKKTEKLRNLNMFVSKTRLAVHNIPLHLSDKQLIEIFKKHTPNARVRGRIMRFMKDVDANGRGKSKGYGFFDFDHHDSALSALRAINNNPSIFSAAHRAIVSFSVENREALNLKEKRKSHSCRPKKDPPSQPDRKKLLLGAPTEEHEGNQAYQGLLGEPGSKNLFNKKNFKKQSAKIAEITKKIKGEKNLKKKSLVRKHREKKQKSSKTPETSDSFSKLVDSYKTKLTKMENKKKWFQE